jgi:hypothetical protein
MANRGLDAGQEVRSRFGTLYREWTAMLPTWVIGSLFDVVAFTAYVSSGPSESGPAKNLGEVLIDLIGASLTVGVVGSVAAVCIFLSTTIRCSALAGLDDARKAGGLTAGSLLRQTFSPGRLFTVAAVVLLMQAVSVFCVCLGGVGVVIALGLFTVPLFSGATGNISDALQDTVESWRQYPWIMARGIGAIVGAYLTVWAVSVVTGLFSVVAPGVIAPALPFAVIGTGLVAGFFAWLYAGAAFWTLHRRLQHSNR